MNSFHLNGKSKFLWLLTVIAILISLFSSCTKNDQKEESKYTANSEEEILGNISDSLTGESDECKTVMEYLLLWGIGDFDVAKFSYFEACTTSVYNYGTGLPDVLTHAKLTAELYVENYYSKIDRLDATEVTNSLLICYVDALNDPYSVYRPPVEADEYTEDMSGKFGGIGVVIEYDDKNETIQITTVYPDSPAEKAGIKVGDFIHAVDGVTVEELGYRNAVYYVRGEIGTEVGLTLIRDGESLTVTATRAEVSEKNVTYAFDETSGIGYVQILAFKGNTFEQFKNAIDALEKMDLKGIIFDMRGNPGGYVESVCSVLSYILPTGKTVLSYQYKGASAVDRQTKDDGIIVSDKDGTTKKIDHTVNVPIVVICDELTASSGEIFTSAIRDYRDIGLLNAAIVGTRTYGKGIMQNSYSYTKDYSTITLTVAYYDPPCGINYHGIGITPDYYVELPQSQRDPETGAFLPVEDTQLSAAHSMLLSMIK